MSLLQVQRQDLNISSYSGMNGMSLTILILVFYNLNIYHKFWIRDGVSESQFNQVLNVELDQIIQVT